MDQSLVFPDHRKVAGRDAVQPRPSGDDEVRFFPAPFLEIVPVDFQMADIGRIVIGDDVLAPIGGSDGRAAGHGKTSELGFCAFERDQLARDDNRAAGGVDQARRFSDSFGVQQQRRARNRRRNGGRARAAVRNVLRHNQHHRARPSRCREFERTGRLLRHFGRRLGLQHGLGNAGEHAVIVDFLKRFPALGGRRHIADDQQHRHRVLSGDMQPDGRIGRAGPTADQTDRRLAGNPAIGRAGESDARLMAGRDQADAVRPALERGEDRKIAFSGNGKGRLDAPCRKRLHQGFPPVHQQCPSACSWLSGSSRRCRCTTK